MGADDRSRGRDEPPRRVDPERGPELLDAAALRPHAVDWVALCGFMRLLSPTFLSAYPGRVINIHPSLLPAFPGVSAQHQALA